MQWIFIIVLLVVELLRLLRDLYGVRYIWLEMPESYSPFVPLKEYNVKVGLRKEKAYILRDKKKNMLKLILLKPKYINLKPGKKVKLFYLDKYMIGHVNNCKRVVE